ncbi:hypothetical protein BGZ58_003135 [Dissophora ornata]|nr:hypothetical protein BGZ58_003135 [Dissophora ornata]
MSLYGDLPPPGASVDAESPGVKTVPKNKDGSVTSSLTATKPALPAGWSSSITRFKPMLNRKLAHPKPKSVARGIPAGFAAQSLPQDQTATTVSSAIAGSSMPSLVPRVGQGVQPTPQAPEMTIDETSWLKERTAQVQRQESDALKAGEEDYN